MHYQLCPAVRVNAECISGTCTLYRIVHLAHIAHTVSIVVTPLHAIWCRSQYNCALLYGSRRTQMWHILQKTSCKFYKTGHCCTSSVYKGCTMLCLAALQHIGLSGICIAFQPCTPYTICVVLNSVPAHHCVVHILACVPIHPHSGTEKKAGWCHLSLDHCATTLDLPCARLVWAPPTGSPLPA